jgi:hypothetical protein
VRGGGRGRGRESCLEKVLGCVLGAAALCRSPIAERGQVKGGDCPAAGDLDKLFHTPLSVQPLAAAAVGFLEGERGKQQLACTLGSVYSWADLVEIVVQEVPRGRERNEADCGICS